MSNHKSVSAQPTNKILGVLFGNAVGDALGLAAEFMTQQEASANYPNGILSYSDIIRDRHRSRWKVGDWTDDTDQMICILDSILEQEEVSITFTAEKIYEWFKNDGMGVGLHTYNVLKLPEYTKYPHKASYFTWNFKGRKSAPNGGVMRTSVLGIYHYWDWQQVKKHCEDICRITHYDTRCVASCVIVGFIISRELLGLPVRKSDLLIVASQYDERVAEYIELAYQSDISSLKLDDKETWGYTLKTLSAALWAYNHCDNFYDTLQAVIMAGGDADTNGAVAGALMGAKLGINAIPIKLIEELNDRGLLNEKAMSLIKLNECQMT